MFIEKIEVPAFRVLRNVVLEFDSAQEPRIFPLGSENGGGKSTLLQLLFALLHCSSDPERFQYLANMLATDQFAGDEDERVIARLTIRMNDEHHVLEFVSLSDGFLKKHLGEEKFLAGFIAEPFVESFRVDVETTEKQLQMHVAAAEQDWSKTRFGGGYGQFLVHRALGGDPINAPMPKSAKEMVEYLRLTIPNLQRNLEQTKNAVTLLSGELERIKAGLASMGYLYVAPYQHQYGKPTVGNSAIGAVACRGWGHNADVTNSLLSAIATNVYLLGPSNQQYLFLGKGVRKNLLKAHHRGTKDVLRPQIEYLKHLDEAEGRMPGFFAYDWLSVEPLVDLFKAARDADFQQVVTTGKYGNRFTELYDEVSALLLGKKVKPDFDPTTHQVIGVNFSVVDSQGQETPISPEDLSQGELKRLMIYAWLKARRATDAFVLIDEIEASFHPDWQHGIIRDLQEWAPRNQYLLATHSYELCTALTPNHVRTLERPLRPGPSIPSSEQK
jgi:predicted ATPase